MVAADVAYTAAVVPAAVPVPAESYPAEEVVAAADVAHIAVVALAAPGDEAFARFDMNPKSPWAISFQSCQVAALAALTYAAAAVVVAVAP